ncbi:hypothetical protein VNI00_015456 [Paramarasmius palmivorus]|uniref:Uncharacterized protein n=1 Tax=Paramarasmius palmivorus TaxID=297713 RepID=A0AAW0BKW9_9AGAR
MLAQSYKNAREYQEVCGTHSYNQDRDSDSSDPTAVSGQFNESQQLVESYLEYLNGLPRKSSVRNPARKVPNVEEELEIPKAAVCAAVNESDTPSTIPSTPRSTRRWRRYLSIDSATAVSPIKLWASARKRTLSLSEISLNRRPAAIFARFRRRDSNAKVPTVDLGSNGSGKHRPLTRVASAPKLNTPAPAQDTTPAPAPAPPAKKARRLTVDEGQLSTARARRAEFNAASKPATPNSTLSTGNASSVQASSNLPAAMPGSQPRGRRASAFPLQLAPDVEPEPYVLAVRAPESMLLPSSVQKTMVRFPNSVRRTPLPENMYPDSGYSTRRSLPLSSASSTAACDATSDLIDDQDQELIVERWWVVAVVLALLILSVLFVIGICLAAVPVWAVCAPCGWVHGLLFKLSMYVRLGVTVSSEQDHNNTQKTRRIR